MFKEIREIVKVNGDHKLSTTFDKFITLSTLVAIIS